MKQEALYPSPVAQDSLEALYATHGPQRPVIYWLILVGLWCALGVLPLIKVDVAVRASGLVRPLTDRADLRFAVSGHVAGVVAQDNENVRAGQVLVTLNTREIDERIERLRGQTRERQAIIDDLRKLTVDSRSLLFGEQDKLPEAGIKLVTEFRTAALRQEWLRLLSQLAAQHLAETKARKELGRYVDLFGSGLATQKDFDDARYEADRVKAESRLLVEQTLAGWQTRMQDEETAVADLSSQLDLLTEERTYYTLRSPADGVLVGFIGVRAGGFIASGQSVGAVSPKDVLRIEVYVSPRDIGLIQNGQPVRLQVDAFPYTQWGVLEGAVESVSGDLVAASTSQGGASGGDVCFKVIVRPLATALWLRNGVRGELRKGMTISARFLVVRRSLLQLLYENASNWLDPRANPTR